MSLSGQLRVRATARLDGRDELIHKLRAKGALTDAPGDAELILAAYIAWGEDCVDHLIGDFAFGIWDGRLQRYFCARDHFGVRPFFFIRSAEHFAFSGSLNELRLDPRVSDSLNEVAVGDYLLFGCNHDAAATIFADIHRLPPGHSLTVTRHGLTTRRYWAPERAGEIRFRDRPSYVARFAELLSRAVADRVGASRVSVSMSGGLDSTSVAAMARRWLGDGSALQGCANVYDGLFPDPERHYSSLAAHHLEMPIVHIEGDRHSLFGANIPGDLDQAEPFLLGPLNGQFHDLLRRCARFSAVALTGWDGDAFMHEPHLSWSGVRSRLVRWLPKPSMAEPVPEWIDGAFARRTNMRERLRQTSTHPGRPKRSGQLAERRPTASRALASPMWTAIFEEYDATATKLDLEVRHPLIDVRLVEFLLGIPAVPWCVNKHILRCAMAKHLPEPVLNRPKTPLAGDPVRAFVRRDGLVWLDRFEVTPQLQAFVDLNRRKPVADEDTSDGLRASVRVFALNHWLRHSYPIRTRAIRYPNQETTDGSQGRTRQPWERCETALPQA